MVTVGSDSRIICFRVAESPDPATRAELETWLSNDSAEDARDRNVVEAALSFDAITIAAITGVIGNAAWAVFPRASAWLMQLRRGSRELGHAELVGVARVRVADMANVDEERVRVDSSTLTPSGWILEAHIGEMVYDIVISVDGQIVSIERRQP